MPALKRPQKRPVKRIGLLGGSFNPAHGGHTHISQMALERLKLDEVWWLVSPGNPLKPPESMAPFAERLAAAEKVADASGKPIIVSDVERQMGFRYSVDTVSALKRRWPRDRFVWIMGADNLIQAHRWRKWRTFFKSVPIAVFPRPTYSLRANKAKAARRFASAKAPPSRAHALAGMAPPAWVFPRARLDAQSATRIRQSKKDQNKKKGESHTTKQKNAAERSRVAEID
ncbi:MAG TPA: nicotinate-nucleotide adenylyltransferase [Rhodospirillales bacterium]|nr:nicotinate-nucleotide adenylyltransferase [Rhodospirillales bacterium]